LSAGVATVKDLLEMSNHEILSKNSGIPVAALNFLRQQAEAFEFSDDYETPVVANTSIISPLTDSSQTFKVRIHHLFAFGSPLALFLTARGVHELGTTFRLKENCAFYNIFHPFDPVAYRLEPLISHHNKVSLSAAHICWLLMPFFLSLSCGLC
jgi:DDHD domain